MSRRLSTYSLVYDQGLGSEEEIADDWASARDGYVSLVGQCSVGLKKDNILLSKEEVAEEFYLNSDILDKIVDLRMQINILYGRLYKE